MENTTVTHYSEKGSRKILVERLAHARNGFTNMIRDNVQYNIFVDGEDKGVLKSGGTLDIRISTEEHEVKLTRGFLNVPSSKIRIPAGNDNYVAFAFNDELKAGPEDDNFREELTEFVINMFRGQGIRDRIKMANNRDKNIYLDIYSTGIELSWSLVQTKGFSQWSTGRDKEKISYQQIGLVPPRDANNYNYWNFIGTIIKDYIEEDEEADMERDSLGGFRLRTKHKLY